jgi:hypothetical protein
MYSAMGRKTITISVETYATMKRREKPFTPPRLAWVNTISVLIAHAAESGDYQNKKSF